MNPQLPPEVMNDLLTLYLAGEASAATRALVEDYARQNPRFARALAGAGNPLPVPDTPHTTEDHEMHTLKLVRQYIFLRSLFFGMGIAFTLIPFLFTWSGNGIGFFLLRDVPGLGYAALSIAAASWSAFYVMHREVRKSGL